MFNVTTAELPALSYLNERKEATDFLDCYSVVSDMPARRAAEIITKFPGWARLLLSIRGVLMAPFGISNEGPDAPDKLGIFPVEIDSEREIVAGFNDKHLDFRVSVISFNGRVFLSTWVHPPQHWRKALFDGDIALSYPDCPRSTESCRQTSGIH